LAEKAFNKEILLRHPETELIYLYIIINSKRILNCLKISKYLFLNMFHGSSYLKKFEEIIYHHLNAIKNKLCLGKINKHDYHSYG